VVSFVVNVVRCGTFVELKSKYSEKRFDLFEYSL